MTGQNSHPTSIINGQAILNDISMAEIRNINAVSTQMGENTIGKFNVRESLDSIL